ncbi:MAG: septal ring lytic transglycosylase RlpA family protein [Candidatus Hinthialibacter antarcticus]|nr:septal ring lytic transglycosylase RlpA family protein [Candidatus Hinthialibacter antarcticus]
MKQIYPSWVRLLALTVLLTTFTGCAGIKIVRIPIPVPTFGFGGDKSPKKTEPTKEAIAQSGDHKMTGTASWYGPKFHGRRTANGERFNMNAMTAAHPSLPFNTRLRVTNLDNGRKCIVRINDRGPFKGGRIVDLSRAAARKLDFERDGLAKVRLEVL